ncbi:MAG TPA: hypothetical protein VEW74_05600, partial [Candidatus Nitrosotalea sp.]|nr:hypothetical protein [Candidatus Nitrosotalea sp.]
FRLMKRLYAFGLCLGAALLASCGGSGTALSPSVPNAPASSAKESGGASPATTTYTYYDLGPGPNGKDAYGYGLSSSAQSGSYYDHSISCGKDCSSKVYYPLAWSGQSSQPVVLLPQFYVEGWAYGAGGTSIVGTLITNNGGFFGYPHAALWQGASHSFTDLNPSGSCGSCQPGSNAYETDGTYIAGSSGSPQHAFLWKITQLKTPVDLNPGGFSYSEAYAVNGKRQAGYAYSSSTNSNHAIFWKGTAASAVDLTTSSLTSAYATGLGAKSEVGCGTPTGLSVTHALLWHNTAKSMKDLQPTGFADSCARAANANVQVGYGHTSGTGALHALVWNGTAASAVDLQQFLASSFTSSEAYAIDSAGDILGSAYSTTTVSWHAVVWHP